MPTIDCDAHPVLPHGNVNGAIEINRRTVATVALVTALVSKAAATTAMTLSLDTNLFSMVFGLSRTFFQCSRNTVSRK